MSLIIDAYNVLHCTHVLPEPWADVEAVELCRLIERAGVAHGRAQVVCDGAPPASQTLLIEGAPADQGLRYIFGNIELVYAGGGRDADSLIERLIEEDTAPRQLVVVSNDRRIQRAARRRRAAAMGSETFLRRLAGALTSAAPRSPEKPAAEPAAEDWLRKFGLDEGLQASPDLESETEHWLREFGFVEDDQNI